MIYFPPLDSLNHQGNHRESLPHMTGESGRLGGEWRTWIPTMTRKAMNSLDIFWFSKSHFVKRGLWRDSVEKYVLFLVSQVYLKWSKIGIQASEISKLKNPSETRQKTHLDADRFNVMPRIEMTDLESLWTQKKPDLTACECWKSIRNTACEQRISGVGLGWFYMILWYLWCTPGLIEWSFAVAGGAEYCRVPVSIQWNDMWRKHEDTLEHDATYTSLLSFACKFESIMLLPFEKNMTY